MATIDQLTKKAKEVPLKSIVWLDADGWMTTTMDGMVKVEFKFEKGTLILKREDYLSAEFQKMQHLLG